MKRFFLHSFKALICLVFLSLTAKAQYCTPTYQQGCTTASQINDFSLVGVSSSISDLATGCSSVGTLPVTCYRDMHSTMSVTLVAGSSYTITASTAISGFPTDIQIFIDFNDNFSFTDPGETVGGGTLSALGLSTNIPITIPVGATAGVHLLRAAASGTDTYPSVTPCPVYVFPTGGTGLIGEVHDYNVNITSTTTTCPPVTGLTVSSITSTSAVLNWTAATGAIGYEWAVTTSATPPASGTLVTLTTANASGLTASTTYYAHVRTKCSATSFSAWVTVSFTTTAATCPPITGLTTSSLTSTSVVLNWTAAVGAIGYEWVVTTSATPPASGTLVTLTTATASGLTPSTTYYAHVRTKCGATTFSGWTSTASFTTPATTACTPPTLTLGAGTSTTQVVNWTAITGATGYEWVVDMVATAPSGSGTATTLTTFTATGLTPATAYYAHVRTNCGTSFSSWATIPFTTGPAPVCDTVTGLSMSSITTTSAILNWTAVTGSIGYEWLVNTTAAAPTGSGIGTTLTTATASSLTAGTTYYAHVRNKCSATTYSAWVTVPFSTLSSACNPVTGLTASAITTTSATVSWTAVTGSVGYQYVINNIVTAPTGSGTNTATTSTSPTGLTPGTTYYAHVRDSCGLTSFSAWNTIPFTTLSATCNAVTGLTASAITSNSATVSWTPAAAALGSQYVINTIATDPIGSGTPTTLTSTNATGLTTATTYYAHVRDSCGPTALSAWVTIPLTTLVGGVGIVNVNAAGGDFSLHAYPNPVSQNVTVEIKGIMTGNAQLQLIDVTGKLIKAISVTDDSVGMDMSGMPAGMYMIRYIDAEHTQTIKINKQ